MRVLGVDPGSLRMGYGIIEIGNKTPNNQGLRKLTSAKGTPVALKWGIVAPKAGLAIEERLYILFQQLQDIIRIWEPDTVAVEEPFVGKNVRSALAIGQAQGIVLMSAAAFGLPVHRYTPTQVKIASTDYGASSKEQVKAMVSLVLNLQAPIEGTDAADALAVAICHIRQQEITEALGRL